MTKNYELLEQEDRSIVDVSYPMYYYIYELIYKCLDFKSHYRGSHYISEFIEYIIKNDIYLYNLSTTKDLYPMIGKMFEIDDKKPERAIRVACTNSWNNMNDYLKNNFFPNGGEKIPTNTEMIYAIYEYIKGHYILEELVKKSVYYKNGEIREETENYLDYKIRFETQRFLYQNFNFSYGLFKYLSIWIDAIVLSVKANKILTDEDIKEILKYLSETYQFYEGTYYSYLSGVTEVNEIDGIMLSFCNRIYQRKDETFSLQKPKNKTYIKEYMNVLSSRVKDNLPFYV